MLIRTTADGMISLDHDPGLVGIDMDGERMCKACAIKSAEAGGLKENGYGPNPVYQSMLEGWETCNRCGEPLNE